jgi:hypothetical protein
MSKKKNTEVVSHSLNYAVIRAIKLRAERYHRGNCSEYVNAAIMRDTIEQEQQGR